MQVGKFLKNIKRADQNKAVQRVFFSKLINEQDKYQYKYRMALTCRGNIFSKTINVQTKIRPYRGYIFSKSIKMQAHLFG